MHFTAGRGKKRSADMGLFDDDVRDGFDAMFDFDRDGKRF